MIAHKVSYAPFSNEYGPYLRVFFYNPLDGKKSPETLAILDSELDIGKIEKMSVEELGKFEKSGVILGRDFLNNFEYVKFYQRRNNGYFLYKIKESKISRRGKYPDDLNKL